MPTDLLFSASLQIDMFKVIEGGLGWVVPYVPEEQPSYHNACRLM